MDRDTVFAIYKAATACADQFDLKGKANPYTSANGHMFSQLNKDGELGIRLPKARQAELQDQYQAGPFKSYGATMRDYVCLTQAMLADEALVCTLLQEGFDFVSAMAPGKKK